MIREILRLVHQLDEWLDTHLGRPYRIILGIGLVIGIVQGVHDIPKKLSAGHGVVGDFLTLVLFAALLVNQLAELYERADARRERRGGRSRS